ncbi:MAG TPA: rRNA maturation RNase YbeY [Fimbriimonas sp.]|nr:rRNA maturation RNase YbeY [Fimbriimonas sp.]
MEPPSTHSITVLNPSGYSVASEPLERAIRAAFSIERVAPSDVRLLLTGDPEIQDLNERFRQIDRPTDVLTFPEGEACSGDIAISVPFAEAQSRLRGIPLQEEIVLLAIHGALHLVGLDDESEDERAEMTRRMARVAASMGMDIREEWCSLLHEEAIA